MSVIVKGMEMPRNCNDCRFAVAGWCYAFPEQSNRDALNNYTRTNWCPLHPLPEKHGRLVDADTLSDEYVLMTGEVQGFRIEPLGAGEARATLRFKRWKDVPTVLEAEE